MIFKCYILGVRTNFGREQQGNVVPSDVFGCCGCVALPAVHRPVRVYTRSRCAVAKDSILFNDTCNMLHGAEALV
jgi:hypothetical protein